MTLFGWKRYRPKPSYVWVMMEDSPICYPDALGSIFWEVSAREDHRTAGALLIGRLGRFKPKLTMIGALLELGLLLEFDEDFDFGYEIKDLTGSSPLDSFPLIFVGLKDDGPLDLNTLAYDVLPFNDKGPKPLAPVIKWPNLVICKIPKSTF